MKRIYSYLISVFILTTTSCGDFLEPKPVSLVTDNLAITSAEDAEQVLLGVYSVLQNGNYYGNLAIGIPGMLSDELIHSGSFPTIKQMDQNAVTSDNVTLQNYWGNAASVANINATSSYNGIFNANVVLERIEKITVSPAVKNTIVGQAKYLRALFHFNLLTLWGDVPIARSTSLTVLSTLPRSPKAEVYAFIIDDLTSASTLLKGVDYGTIVGRDEKDRVRAGEWAVKALLARVQLFKGDKAAAGILANEVITLGGYTLAANYGSIFQSNSTETIFEVFSNVNDPNGLAFQFRLSGRYEYAPSPQLVSAFQTGDARASVIANIASTKPEAAKYNDVATGTDRPIVSRLAEMHLIRAEANLATAPAQALQDINLLRLRAGALPQTDPGFAAFTGFKELTAITLADILNERFIELCFEGHRWNDLIRTGTVDQVMSVINPVSWKATSALMPIPNREIQQNPALAPQNPGY
jgi:starch-binding outer membrane protein, SusD/RagB family